MTTLRNRGFSLLETTLAMLTVGITLSALWSLALGVQQMNEDKSNAAMMGIVGRAAQAYINDQSATLLPAVAVNAVVRIRIRNADTGSASYPSLVAAGFLPAGFSNQSLGGGEFAFYIRHEDPNSTAADLTDDSLVGLVVTLGATAVTDYRGSRIAGLIGPAGGALYSATSTIVDGAYGNWQVDLTGWTGVTPGAGQLAVLTKFSGEAGSVGGGATDIDGLSDGITNYTEKSLFLGEGSGANYSTSPGNNTGVGYNALAELTNGFNNSALGAYALASIRGNATGVCDPAGGLWSCDNTAIGANAMRQGLNLARNTAAGVDALRVAENTYQATAVGYQAMGAFGGGLTAVDNTAIGYQALYGSASSTSGNNIAVGAYALLNETTGGDNIGIGYRAMATASAARTKNIAIGYMAGDPLTSGDNNILIGSGVADQSTPTLANAALIGYGVGGGSAMAGSPDISNSFVIGDSALIGTGFVGVENSYAVGAEALQANTLTLGSGSLIVGYQAMKSGRGGNGNIYVGAQAAVNRNGGSSNYSTVLGYQAANGTAGQALPYQATFLGARAGYNVTTGYATAIGYGAMQRIQTATGCVAIGSYAMGSSTAGTNSATYSVAAGYQSLQNVASPSSNNVALGAMTLSSNSTGSNNIAIGYKAGTYSDGIDYAAITIGSRNIIIGYQLSTPAAGTNDWMNLGTAIRADMSTRQVVIGGTGVETPLAAGSQDLYVVGTMEATNYFVYSDRNLKRAIHPLSSALDLVMRLRPVAFRWKESGDEALGFIAQDVEAVIPAVVHGGVHKSVEYCSLISPVVGAVQSQHQNLAHIKADLDRMQADLDHRLTLARRLAELEATTEGAR